MWYEGVREDKKRKKSFTGVKEKKTIESCVKYRKKRFFFFLACNEHTQECENEELRFAACEERKAARYADRQSVPFRPCKNLLQGKIETGLSFPSPA